MLVEYEFLTYAIMLDRTLGFLGWTN